MFRILDKHEIPTEQNRQQKTFNSPFLWLLAATLLARASGKTSPQIPWIPYKTYTPNYLTSVWYPSGESNSYSNEYPTHIKPPTITQNQIIHIHETPESDESYEIETKLKTNESVPTNLEKPGKELLVDELNFDMKNVESDFDNEVAESNVNYRRQRPEQDSAKLKRNTPRYTNKRITEQNNNNKRNRYNTSKRGNRRPYITTTYPSYNSEYYDDDDEDDERITQRIKSRRKPTTKRYRRKTTTPMYEYDEYDYEDNSFESTERVIVKNDGKRRRKPSKFNNRRPTTTENSYDDYYQSQHSPEVQSYEDEIDYPSTPNVKVPVVARQAVTTESSTTEFSSSTETVSSTFPTTSTSTTPPTTSPPATNVTHPTGYGYGPYSGNSNVSITYGPPGSHNYYNYDYTNPSGYGPSNGNDNISITYGPPTDHRVDYVSPLLDAWYSQYAAKNAVVRRIQDLIQNNIYSNNPDGHYNDNNY